jgi:hypothetical protein
LNVSSTKVFEDFYERGWNWKIGRSGPSYFLDDLMLISV